VWGAAARAGLKRFDALSVIVEAIEVLRQRAIHPVELGAVLGLSHLHGTRDVKPQKSSTPMMSAVMPTNAKKMAATALDISALPYRRRAELCGRSRSSA